jgi:hypothetical protein
VRVFYQPYLLKSGRLSGRLACKFGMQSSVTDQHAPSTGQCEQQAHCSTSVSMSSQGEKNILRLVHDVVSTLYDSQITSYHPECAFPQLFELAVPLPCDVRRQVPICLRHDCLPWKHSDAYYSMMFYLEWQRGGPSQCSTMATSWEDSVSVGLGSPRVQGACFFDQFFNNSMDATNVSK